MLDRSAWLIGGGCVVAAGLAVAGILTSAPVIAPSTDVTHAPQSSLPSHSPGTVDEP